MVEQAGKQAPDIVELWREWLTQSERQFNAFFNEMMGSEAFGRSAATAMESYVTFQRMMAQTMERYLAFMNLPTRADVVGLGETLRAIEARLARIEETLQIAAEAVDRDEGRVEAPSEPRRTRRVPGVPPEEIRPEAAVPEELRR